MGVLMHTPSVGVRDGEHVPRPQLLHLLSHLWGWGRGEVSDGQGPEWVASRAAYYRAT